MYDLKTDFEQLVEMKMTTLLKGSNMRQRPWHLSWKHFALTVLVIFCFIEAPRIGDWIVVGQQADDLDQVKQELWSVKPA